MKGNTDMRDRLIQKFTKAKKGSLGYTLTEMLVVIGIIAVICAIAIPSVIAISRALRFRQRNDYAKAIFMAAQANLTEMRSDGGLAPLQGGSANSLEIPADEQFPEEHREEYVFTASRLGISGSQRDSYALVLPVGSVESTLREQQVIIEYNPITGNVYSVFYCDEKDVNILELYMSADSGDVLPRDDEAARKKMMLGYYDGSGLSSSELELESANAEVTFTNGEEGLVTVRIPMPRAYYGKHAAFMSSLQVDLTVEGEHGGSFSVRIKNSPNNTQEEEAGLVVLPSTTELDVDGATVLVTCALDSLVDYGSFANLSTGTYQPYAEGNRASGTSLTQLQTDDFADDAATAVDESRILPGDNVTIQANVRFYNTGSNPAVTIRPGIVSGVNPMFEYLEVSPSNPDKYILAVANGRNMQNLNAIHPEIAAMVESVVFTADIYWNDTVAYYNSAYGHSYTDADTDSKCDLCGMSQTGHGAGKAYASSAVEAPGRALPYFVPIHNEGLFGTAQFIYPGRNEYGSLGDILMGIIDTLLGLDNGDVNRSDKVPTLTDELDSRMEGTTGKTYAQNHATISGQDMVNHDGAQIYYLNIDTTKYATGADYYAGSSSTNVDRFTGLFGYVNTTVNNLHVVNPIVKGYDFVGNNNPATGALIGAAGYNTLVTNCSTYIDVSEPNFIRAALDGHKAYDAAADQTWYGVSGKGAVGGLVGYAKSHRTITGDLIDNEDYLAFSRCFAAVNVSGVMRDYERYERNRLYYGYSNGIGGFIGNSQLTNFYNCYSSGDVIASGGAVYKTDLQGSFLGSIYNIVMGLMGRDVELSYNGRTSIGTGGFVGTSHGTRYTNCFATGDVQGWATKEYGDAYGIGGFVGIMSYEETLAYGNDEDVDDVKVAQRTVFDSCYSVGRAYVNGGTSPQENFSGANARIRISAADIGAGMFAGDYYRLLAPYYDDNRGATPGYATWYIFKDSYYLSQLGEDQTNTNSNECASVASYDTLSDLLGNHHNNKDNWINKRIAKVKQYEFKYLLGLITVTYDYQYFRGTNGALEAVYYQQYQEGYPDDHWGAPSAARTHSYALNAAGAVYPFTMLNDLEYYGNWPNRPLDAGLAYYEYYEIEEGGTSEDLGIYFDREDTENNKVQNDKLVVSDGYTILSGNKSDYVALIVPGEEAGTTKQVKLTAIGEYEPGGDYSKTFGIFPIPAEYLVADDVEFYTELKVYIDPVGTTAGDTYTFYYNPNVALSQVNPQDGTKTAKKPDTHPDQIFIRSARQFAALGTMENFWTKDYHYVQQLNIDAAKYTWGTTEETNKIPALSPIGTAAKPFSGTYTATGGYVTQAELAGFVPGISTGKENVVMGLFGVIGDQGQVTDLKIRLGDAEEEKPDPVTASGAAGNMGILAGVSAGTIKNVDLELNTQVTLHSTGENARAGLLIGAAGGTMTECDITAVQPVTIKAPYAGAAVGYANKLTVEECTVALSKGDQTCGLLGEGTWLGGFAGWLENTAVTDVDVTLEGMDVKADYAGGFAGSITGGSVTTLNVNLTGKAENKKAAAEDQPVYLAGVAANADGGVLLVNVSAVIDGEMAADQAAGLYGLVGDATVRNTTVQLDKASISGKNAAAGAAIACGAKSIVENTTMELLRGTVASSEGKAAGFAVDFQGKAQGVRVRLAESGSGKITGKTEAAGFACAFSGEAGSVTVTGAGSITAADEAAGFAVSVSGNGYVAASGVTPALDDTAAGYLGNSNSNLTVNAAEAAGFVLLVDTADASSAAAGIHNSYVLAKVTGAKAYGFCGTNAGTIEGCTANVTFENVRTTACYAFVGTNSGTVSNSYGWYGDGAEADFDKIQVVPVDAETGAYADSGKYFSSYFVDINIQQDEDSDDKTVTLFDINGKMQTLLPASLASPDAILMLNGAEGSSTYRWQSADAYDAYPYSNFRNSKYLYPMLRVHRGDWVTTPQYAFGIGYYEKYTAEDGTVTWSLKVIDLSDPEQTVESEKLDFAGVFTVGTDKTVTKVENAELFGWNSNIDKDGAGYLVFVKANTDKETGKVSAAVEFSGKNSAGDLVSLIGGALDIPGSVIKTDKPSRYGFFEIAPEGMLTILDDQQQEKATLITWFADTIDQKEEPYKIRTGEQLRNMVKMPGAAYVQAHNNIVTDSFAVIDNFNGSYDGQGGTVTHVGDVNTGWMNTVSGTVQNLSLVLGNVNAPVFGTVPNGVTLSLKGLSTGTIGAGGAVFGTVEGAVTVDTDKTISVTGIAAATETAAAGKLFGDVGGSVNVGPIKVSGGVDGQLFGDVNGSVNTKEISAGEVNGQIFGTVTEAFINGRIAVGNVEGKLFGDVTKVTVLGEITSGEVNGQLFGDVLTKGAVQLSAIRVGTSETPAAVNGKLFGKVFGKLQATTISTGAIGAQGQIFGDVAVEESEKLMLNSITTNGNAVSGRIFGAVKNAAISQNITTGAVSGQIFGDVTGSVTIGTENAASDFVAVTTGVVSGQVFGAVNNTDATPLKVNGAIKTGAVSGQIFGNANYVTVSGGITAEQINTEGKIFGTVSGAVSTGKITTGAMAGTLIQGVSGNASVTVSGISAGAVSGNLISSMSGGTVTTGKIGVASLNKSLVGTFNSGILQGAGDPNTAKITISTTVASYLFSETVGGTVCNYATELNTGSTGLTETLSGTVKNVSLKVNTTMTADVIKTTGEKASVEGLTVEVSGDMSGRLIGEGNGSLKTLNLTVTGNKTKDVITSAGAVEGLTVTIGTKDENGAYAEKSGEMTGALIGAASGNVTNVTLTAKQFNQNDTGAVIGQVTGKVENVTLDIDGSLTGNALTGAASTDTLKVDVGTKLDGTAVDTVTGAAKNITVKVGTDLTGNAITKAGAVSGLSVTVDGNMTGSLVGAAASVTGAADTNTLYVKGNVTLADNEAVIGQVSGEVKNVTLDIDGSLTGNALTGAASIDTLKVDVGTKLDGTAVDTVTSEAKNITVKVGTDLTGNAITKAGAVSGLSVTVDGNMTGSLVGEAASVTGTADTNTLHVKGNVSGSVIGTVTTVTNVTLDIDGNLGGNAVASVESVNGLKVTIGTKDESGAYAEGTGEMSHALIGAATGNLNGVSLEAAKVTVSTDAANPNFGVITASLGEGQSLTGSSVTVGTLTVTAGENGAIGGLVGENNGSIGTVTTESDTDGNTVTKVSNGCTVSVSAFLVTGADGKTVDIGGLVGSNSGTIGLNDKSTVNITYTQTAGDSANIGGIVGLMNGGTMTGTAGTTVISGEIKLADGGDASGRSYIIGGAVGNLMEGSASKANVNVTVAPAWAGVKQYSPDTFGTSGITNQGPVGMFVGFAGEVTIEDCASIETSNKTFQFLGEALLTPLFDSVPENWYMATSTAADGKTAYSDDFASNSTVNGVLMSAAQNCNFVQVSLNGCFFNLNGLNREQIYGVNQYYYSRSEVKESVFTIGDALQSTANPYTYRAESDDIEETPIDTCYYYLDGTEYVRAYVKYEETSSGWFQTTRTFTLLDVNGNVLTSNNNPSRGGSLFTGYYYYVNFELYDIIDTVPSDGAMYLAVANSNALFTDGTPTAIPESKTFEQRDSLYGYIWVYSDGVIKNLANESVEYAIMSSIDYTTLDMIYAVGDLEFQLVALEETEEASSYYVYTFVYQNDLDYQRQYVTYTPFDAASASLDETDLPGETGEVPEGSESTGATEPTEDTGSALPTETATEPPATVDGNEE